MRASQYRLIGTALVLPLVISGCATQSSSSSVYRSSDAQREQTV